jgi:hypothetical protein
MGRRLDSAVWGLVGGLAFLVLVQGYELATGRGVAALVKVGVAVGVLAVVSLLAYAAGPPSAGNERA